ncbi:MAG: Gfo/Idh/MocA family oxidoreductase [Sedimentisphaerales bacterium]
MSARTFILLLAVATITTIGFVNTDVIAALPSDSNQQADANAKPPFRLAIAGLVHDHVTGPLKDIPHRKDITLVGIAEPNAKLAATYAARYHLPQSIIYTDLNKMLDETKPQAVVAHTSTFDHLQVVQACAAHHIDVMMEKPLAVSIEHATAMAEAAKKAGTRVLVNYSTTWEPVNTLLRDMAIDQNAIGEIRKIVFYKGHFGPKEIGCTPEFLKWLTDPNLNGGGALFDFGCYGANLATWFLNNQKPLSVTAVTRQTKPDIYPKVDDDATVVITYPKAQVIIMASWSWPYGRDDIEIYGTAGSIQTIDGKTVILRINGKPDQKITANAIESPYSDSLTYLAAIVNGGIKPQELASLENNMTVTEILCAARRSAKSHSTIQLR